MPTTIATSASGADHGAALFVQGIPIGTPWMRCRPCCAMTAPSLQALAFCRWWGCPWVVKFLWAPLVDNHWSPRFGRRRSWIIPLQCVVTMPDPAQRGRHFAAAAGLCVALLAVASLASATRDIATDGMAARNTSAVSCCRASMPFKSPG
ncbi:hypothetical protein M8494_25255 [Serratia ureilytica]